jgi:hypothetical protein
MDKIYATADQAFLENLQDQPANRIPNPEIVTLRKWRIFPVDSVDSALRSPNDYSYPGVTIMLDLPRVNGTLT